MKGGKRPEAGAAAPAPEGRAGGGRGGTARSAGGGEGGELVEDGAGAHHGRNRRRGRLVGREDRKAGREPDDEVGRGEAWRGERGVVGPRAARDRRQRAWQHHRRRHRRHRGGRGHHRRPRVSGSGSPVSSSVLRLAITPGPPPEIMSTSTPSGTRSSWMTVSLTCSPSIGSVSQGTFERRPSARRARRGSSTAAGCAPSG